MLPGIFQGFRIAQRSMQSSQMALAVHSSNIARANDPTYTRKDVVHDGRLDRATIARLRDTFIDDQYRRNASIQGDAESRRAMMNHIEDIFGDPAEGGLRKAVDQFFTDWQSLAERPADPVVRQQVIFAGQALVREVKEVNRQLDNVERGINDQMNIRVSEVNTLLEQVFELNTKIMATESADLPRSDLQDQRDAALDRLAKLTGAVSVEQENRTVRVIIGALPVVDGPTLVKLKLTDNGSGPVPEWEGFTNFPFKGEGTISGLLSVRTGEIARVRQDVDKLIKAVATKVNDLHRTGTDLQGQTNIDFFTVGAGLSDVVVNPNLKPENVAAAGGPGAVSDGEVARQIAGLADTGIVASSINAGQTESARTFYRNLIGWIGTRGMEASRTEEIAQAHLRTGEQQRQAQWGVSIDEETAGLQLQQRAFQAASRVISVMDDMLDTLINRTAR